MNKLAQIIFGIVLIGILTIMVLECVSKMA